MTKLKTLKDLEVNECCTDGKDTDPYKYLVDERCDEYAIDLVRKEEFRQTAINHIKEYANDDFVDLTKIKFNTTKGKKGWSITTSEFSQMIQPNEVQKCALASIGSLMYIFNITAEELK